MKSLTVFLLLCAAVFLWAQAPINFSSSGGLVGSTGYIVVPLMPSFEVFYNDPGGFGGMLSGETYPNFRRVNGTTDPAMRITWEDQEFNIDGRLEFTPVFVPADFDNTKSLAIKFLIGKTGNMDTNNLTLAVFQGVGGTNKGGTITLTGATNTLYTHTIAANQLSAGPSTLAITLTPTIADSTTLNDKVHVYNVWIEYTRR